MLSGTSLTAAQVATSVGQEGGFIAVDVSGLLNGQSNDFLLDSDTGALRFFDAYTAADDFRIVDGQNSNDAGLPSFVISAGTAAPTTQPNSQGFRLGNSTWLGSYDSLTTQYGAIGFGWSSLPTDSGVADGTPRLQQPAFIEFDDELTGFPSLSIDFEIDPLSEGIVVARMGPTAGDVSSAHNGPEIDSGVLAIGLPSDDFSLEFAGASFSGDAAATYVAESSSGRQASIFDLNGNLVVHFMLAEDSLDQGPSVLDDVTPGQPGAGQDQHDGRANPKAKLLVIDEHLHRLARNKSDSQDLREGGSLNIASVVHATQNAYETQISALIADNLDRDRALPSVGLQHARPVSAELARMVTFEVAHHRSSDETAAEVEATEFEATELEATEASSKPKPIKRPATKLGSVSIETADQQEVQLAKQIENAAAAASGIDGSGTDIHLTSIDAADQHDFRRGERLENKQREVSLVAFAEWPVLASVVTSYLIFEYRKPAAGKVEKKPRRRKSE